MTAVNKGTFGIATLLLGASAIAEANITTDPSPVVTQPPAALAVQKNSAALVVEFFDGGCDGGVISRNSLRCN